jgi:hypothetical protein
MNIPLAYEPAEFRLRPPELDDVKLTELTSSKRKLILVIRDPSRVLSTYYVHHFKVYF